MKFWLLSAAIAASAMTACSSPRLVGGDEVTVVQASAMPPPTIADLAAPGRPYLIGPFDRISVDVFGVSELSRSVQADAAGRISLPLVGVIEAAGKTPLEVAELIGAGLRGRYVRDPIVTVNLEETVSQVITVDGEVREPGIYPVVGRMTLIRAVARAKGITENAQQNHVVVFRTVANQRLATLYDLRAIRQGLYADPEVFANDVVVVSEDRARRLFQTALQAAGLLTTPIVAVLRP